ncbi:glutathione S-transferase family protein [Pseudoduganella sp. OTU4001]|uniref:glutathione S-transferase family protein n=1 Tax=Pseudoduganella sp. OTU4001 TaxID=3043854 RepID=UPI00313BE926
MYTVYTWATPNGRKPLILLEELGLPYEVEPINLREHEQFTPAFLAISPNNKIPAIRDGALTLFESGAILTYLAEKHERFLAPSGPQRYRTLQWLYWQVAGLGPMLGQLGFFEKQDAAVAKEHFSAEAERLLNVLDRALAGNTFVAGDHFTIADIACYPWTQAAAGHLGLNLGGKPAVQRWLEQVGSRPAVERAMAWQPATP